MDLEAALPGMLATSGSSAGLVMALDGGSFDTCPCGPVSIASWRIRTIGAPEQVLRLSPLAWTREGPLSDRDLGARLRRDPAALGSALPPFAASIGDNAGLTVVADSMGFRPLFHSDPADRRGAVLSTSALLGGRLRGSGLDDVAVAVQSLLGWQLGQRTLARGVSKLEPGRMIHLGADGLRPGDSAPSQAQSIGLLEAVRTTTRILRESLCALLDEYPDAVLQLTGGQDSRLLLSAIPRARRRGLRAMTLGTLTSRDVEIAQELAFRDGLRYEVRDVPRFDDVTPEQAWQMVRIAAIRLDGMSDPLARAALNHAERRFDGEVRISGLGGEVARGFYYQGRVTARGFTRQDANDLASWRMFVNESVESGMLTDEFAAWGREVAIDEVFGALSVGGPDWFRALDMLYLRDRMQRWAGATDTVDGHLRTVINPMLDPEFVSVAMGLAPGTR